MHAIRQNPDRVAALGGRVYFYKLAAFTASGMIAALSGALNGAETEVHPIFKVAVPKSCPGVPALFLDARGMWPDKEASDRAARDLSGRFNKNFEKFTGEPFENHT